MNSRTGSCGRVSALAAAIAVSLLAMGCTKQQAAPPPRPPAPVVTATVRQKVVPVEVVAVGNVEAFSSVAIKAQVSGQLLEVHFREGEFVRKGQLLVTIDPRPYEAALAQAKAALARDKAVSANNRLQAQRYAKLLQEGIMPASQVETFTSAADASDAVVSSDEAAIKTALLNLEYCTINSPIDGRTGALMLKPGNLVKVADVPIVVINQVNPIFVNFAVPQQHWPDIQKYMARGTLKVKARVPQDTGAGQEGSVSFVDNAVDPTTGTMHLRATFNNSRNLLWPGLFVNVVLTLSEQANAVVIPAQAILDGDKGAYVYVVSAEKRVEPRPIETGRTIDGETVIQKGLKPGEIVVTDGQTRLEPHARVEIKGNAGDAVPPVNDN